MSQFDEAILEAHEESLSAIGEQTHVGESVLLGVFSEVTTRSGVSVSGFDGSAEATFTLTWEELKTAIPDRADIIGTLIERTATGKAYRVSEYVDNGGGLVDLELIGDTE